MAIIVLPEDISVKKVKEFHQKFVDALKEGDDEIILDFSSVKQTDLSVYQIIYAGFRECRKMKKTLKIKGASNTIKDQLKLCGLMRSNP